MKKQNTAEKYYRHALAVYAALTVLIVLLFVGTALACYASGADGISFLYGALFVFLFLAAPTVYYAAQYRYYKNVILSDVQTVKPEGTDTAFFRSVGLRATVVSDGSTRSVITKHVFGVGLAGPNRLDDYIDKNVEIGYDKEKDEWIVVAL
ncbi:MAG: hypothetical protein KIG36_06245 [Eubacteriales bacterium]|nr:hypothetical protein [Eubacteriales bacterium]